MHEDRLSYLASHNRKTRNIVSCVRNSSGHWEIMLDCGHNASCVGHMDASLSKTWSCTPCGLEYVKSEPQYAAEFKK